MNLCRKCGAAKDSANCCKPAKATAGEAGATNKELLELLEDCDTEIGSLNSKNKEQAGVITSRDEEITYLKTEYNTIFEESKESECKISTLEEENKNLRASLLVSAPVISVAGANAEDSVENYKGEGGWYTFPDGKKEQGDSAIKYFEANKDKWD